MIGRLHRRINWKRCEAMLDSQGPALHLLHGSPAAAIAFHDPKLCAVVVASHSPRWVVGQVVDVTLPHPEEKLS